MFTSLRVTSGRCRDLDAHLARLDASARELFGKPMPPGLPAELAACLDRRPSGRLRISARPVGGPIPATFEVMPAGDTPASVALWPVIVPGGLGGHKWQDRRLVDRAREQAGPGPDEQLLLLDDREQVLETDRASLFTVIDGVLRTPPADGRLLPGVTRAVVIRLARHAGIPGAEAPVSLGELRRASEVFVTNSVHGLVAIRSVGPGGEPDQDHTGADTVWSGVRPVSARLRPRSPVSPPPAAPPAPPPPSP